MNWGCGCQADGIAWIPMDQIRLHRVTQLLVPNPVERGIYQYREWIVRRMIRILPRADPHVAAILVGRIPVSMGFNINSPTGRRKLLARMCLVYTSMKETGVMYNPLHVSRQKDGLYYLARGSQRFCALTALAFTGKVPCRVGQLNDRSLIKSHPYDEVVGLYQNRREP